MIPEQIHFIHGLKRGDPFTLTDRLAIRSAHVNNPKWWLRLWSPEKPTGEHWEKLIATTPVQWSWVPESVEWNGNFIPRHQHRADLLRHTILYALGGAYMDLDTLTLQPFPPHYLAYDTVIGCEWHGHEVSGLCNAVMLSKQFSQFQWQWLSLWQNFKGEDWNEFSVRAPWMLSKVFPRLVRAVDRELLGYEYRDCLRYFEKDYTLPGVVVAHLWRTGCARYLDSLTEEAVKLELNTYCREAKKYL